MNSRSLYTIIPAACLLAALTSGCSSDGKSGGDKKGKGSPGFNLQGFGSDIENSSDKAGFMAKAKQASRLTSQQKTRVRNLGSEDAFAVSAGPRSLANEVASLRSTFSLNPLAALGNNRGSDNMPADSQDPNLQDDPWGLDSSPGSTQMQLDFGQSLGSAESCADAIQAIRTEYDNALSQVQQQFKLLKELDSNDAESAGLKPIEIPNRAVAYSFDQNGFSGTIEGAADASRILIKYTIAGVPQSGGNETCNLPSDPSPDAPNPVRGTNPGAPSGSDDSQATCPADGNTGSEVFAPSPLDPSGEGSGAMTNFAVEAGILANLETKAIEVGSSINAEAEDGGRMTIALTGKLDGGDNLGMSQKLGLSYSDPKSKDTKTFDMTLSLVQTSPSRLELSLATTGMDMGEEKIPAINESYTLETDSSGACVLKK